MAFARGRVRIVVGVLAVGALLVFLRPSPLPVTVARVERRAMRETVDGVGWTRVRDRYTVSAPAAGRLGRTPLREGDSVARGQVIAHLDPAPLDARTRAAAIAAVGRAEDAERVARATMVGARNAAEQAHRARARAQELDRSGMIAKEERERLELAAATADRGLEAADFAAQAATH
ncbi:MAG: biotin/lipoyl-binding protein, partial [Gemmatimonadales bacterium]|nr:biotin/lipoyl-binding protein [Gemmatimonadales bacterium]